MAYEIPINTDGLQMVYDLFGKIADSADKAHQATQRLNQDVRGLKGSSASVDGAGGSSGSGGGGGSGSGGGAGGSRRGSYRGPSDHIYQYARGPYQARDNAEQALKNARDSGDAKLIRDAEIKMMRAQRAVDRAEHTSNPLMDAFMTSRIGPGGRLYPLINRLKAAGLGSAEELEQKMLGMGFSSKAASGLAGLGAGAMSMAGPVAMGAVAAGGIYAGAEMYSAQARAGANAWYTMGGSPKSVGEAMGYGGENAAQKAMAFAEALRNGTYGSSYMRSQGVNDLGAATVDKSKNYVRAIDALSRIKDDNQAIRVARDLGMSDDLWIRDLSPGSRERLKRSNAERGTPEERRAEAEWRGGKEVASNEFGKLVRTSLGPTASIAGGWLRGINNLFDQDFWTGNPLSADWWSRHTGSGGSGAGAPGGSSGGGSASAIIRPMPKDGTDIVGGGNRSRGAIPAGVKGWVLSNQLDDAAARLGAF